MTINFSEDVSGFDIADLTLSRDDQPVVLDGLSLTPVSGSQYTIDLGVNSTDAPEGSYELTVVATDSEIVDVAGNPLSASVRVAPPKPISKPE